MKTRSQSKAAVDIPDLINEARSHASSLARGTPLSQEACAQLHDLMQRVPLASLGFDESALRDPYQASIKGLRLGERKSGLNHSYYLSLFEDYTLTVGIFCLPAGSSLPLHNHPGMTVLSRLLFGSMRATSYDLLDGEVTSGAVGDRCKVRKAFDGIVKVSQLSPEDASLSLFPAQGNIHEFVAESPCAFLDVLVPPYAPPEHDCTYFRIIKEERGINTLEVILEPSDFKVKNLR